MTIHARWHHHRHVRRHALANPSPTEGIDMQAHTLLRRAPGPDCKPGDNSPQCELPAGASSHLPIILGSAIPIVVAMIVIFFLHRCHLRKLKEEDKMDKTKSMDFGMGNSAPQAMPGAEEEKPGSRSRRQMSLDMDIVASPYLLPAKNNNSRESFHSMAKTIHTGEDRYGPPNASSSSPSQHQRHSLVYTPDTNQESNMKSGLLNDAQQMPNSTPPRNIPLFHPTGSPPVPRINMPLPPPPVAQTGIPYGLPSSPRDGHQKQRDQVNNGYYSPNGAGDHSLSTGGASIPQRGESPFADPPVNSPRQILNERSEDSDVIQFRFSDASVDDNFEEPMKVQSTDRMSLAPTAFDARRISMGFRPLPPEGNPDDTAEERAMRIRSFYKEYFSVEDSAAAPPMPPPPAAYSAGFPSAVHSAGYPPHGYPQQHSHGFDDSAMIDPNTGLFIPRGTRPFAETPTRRAMTPPPRMPPQFDPSRSRTGSATGGRFLPPEPRSFSSASGRIPGPGIKPRRQFEPLQPLHVLPTPSMVSEDAFAEAIMFAPPPRVGTSESSRGGVRPYSPNVAPHVPLASAFDELSLMPSPHMLRKSSTFTALDFAPPRKFRNDGEASDAGSIHSSRSGASALQVHNIRSGAYRVSRIPTDVVPLKDNLTAGLKPTWDMGY